MLRKSDRKFYIDLDPSTGRYEITTKWYNQTLYYRGGSYPTFWTAHAKVLELHKQYNQWSRENGTKKIGTHMREWRSGEIYL
jgi:hypothetical protein